MVQRRLPLHTACPLFVLRSIAWLRDSSLESLLWPASHAEVNTLAYSLVVAARPHRGNHLAGLCSHMFTTRPIILFTTRISCTGSVEVEPHSGFAQKNVNFG